MTHILGFSYKVSREQPNSYKRELNLEPAE